VLRDRRAFARDQVAKRVHADFVRIGLDHFLDGGAEFVFAAGGRGDLGEGFQELFHGLVV